MFNRHYHYFDLIRGKEEEKGRKDSLNIVHPGPGPTLVNINIINIATLGVGDDVKCLYLDMTINIILLNVLLLRHLY